MKNKNALVLAASLLLLGACGGTTPNESSKAPAPSDAATSSEIIAPITSEEPTPTTSEEPSPDSSSEQAEHVHEWVKGEEVGAMYIETCSCGEKAYRVDIDADEIFDDFLSWDAIDLPRAKYRVLANIKSASADDGDRKWYNMATSDPIEETRTEKADTSAMAEYRYHLEEDDVIINPTNTKSRAEDGVGTDAFTWVEMVDGADFGGYYIDLNAGEGMPGMMYIESLRFIKVGETDKGYTVTFDCDEHCHVEIFKSQDYTKTPVESTTAVSRDGDTGQITSSGDGQVNFALILDEGYTYNPLTGTEDCYKNIKLVDGSDEQRPIFRITKISDNMTLIATTSLIPEQESGFVATFVHPTEYTVSVYKTQTDAIALTNGEVSDTAFARTKDGVATSDSSLEPQINFVINGTLPEGKSWSVTATEGAYKNIKQDPEGSGAVNYFRITKIKSDLTVTIALVDVVA